MKFKKRIESTLGFKSFIFGRYISGQNCIAKLILLKHNLSMRRNLQYLVLFCSAVWGIWFLPKTSQENMQSRTCIFLCVTGAYFIQVLGKIEASEGNTRAVVKLLLCLAIKFVGRTHCLRNQPKTMSFLVFHCELIFEITLLQRSAELSFI